MRGKLKLVFGALMFCFCSSNVSADLVEVTDPGSPGGTNNVTRDTDTGLEWLDWTASTNISYNAMIPLLVDGQLYGGWQHATLEQLKVFMENVGLPVSVFPDTSVKFDGGASYQTFVAYVGETPVNLDSTTAITADFETFTPGPSQYFAYAVDDPVGATYTLATATDGLGRDAAGSSFGHALVRDYTASVPEPSSFFALSSIGLIGLMRRQRRS